MDIGKNIKSLRTSRGIAQEQLAKHLNVSFQAVSKWENGINLPDTELLPRIAGFFDVSIDALFSPDALAYVDIFRDIPDDDCIRVVQLKGKEVLQAADARSYLQIVFPRDCNETTRQYFKVEVYGNLLCDSSINGDVAAQGRIDCHVINGDVRAYGPVQVREVNGRVIREGNEAIEGRTT